VVIVRDVDRLTRNLADWDRFEKAAIEHRVILSAYAGGDLDLSTPVLDALESPRVQEAVASKADTDAPRRAELLEETARRRTSGPRRAVTGPRTSSTRKTGWMSSSAPTTASPAPARNTTG
jgi:DNA invertase Pin-like site-specific DNA recombinase